MPDRARAATASRSTSTSTSSTAPAARTCQHLRHLRRRHQDQLRDVPALSACSAPACSAAEAANTKALIFNVKGEDLLFLDHPNTPARRRRPVDGYARLGPARRPRSRTCRGLRPAPGRRPNAGARRGQPAHRAWTPSTGRWRSSAPTGCCRSCSPTPTTSASSTRWSSTTSPPSCAATAARSGRRRRGSVDGVTAAHLRATWSTSSSSGSPTTDTRVEWAGPAVGLGTVNAFVRRLISSQARDLARLIRGRPAPAGDRHRINTAESAQVTVVDLHNLPDRAQRFVVGVTLKTRVRAQGEGGHGQAAAVRRARRAEQVRAARGLVARSRRSCSTSPSGAGRSASS